MLINKRYSDLNNEVYDKIIFIFSPSFYFLPSSFRSASPIVYFALVVLSFAASSDKQPHASSYLIMYQSTFFQGSPYSLRHPSYVLLLRIPSPYYRSFLFCSSVVNSHLLNDNLISSFPFSVLLMILFFFFFFLSLFFLSLYSYLYI